MQHGTLTGEPVHLKYFDVSEAGFAWKKPLPRKIQDRRVAMDNKFIFDLLLERGGIDRVDQLYPPHNQEDLELLLQAIEVSDYDDLKKECLVYYLLKWHNDGREVRFQAERSIPSQFANLADAYWHLDAGREVARAVSFLSDRRLNGDYASQIIHAISISANPTPLIIQYVRTAKPRLTDFTDIWTYTLALIDQNFLEAWQFQRTFSETHELRSKLLNKILNWVISTALLPNTMKALLSLPLSPFEQKFLHKYALEPPEALEKTAISLLRELVCVRLIQSGKYAEAVKLDHEFASSTLHESKADAESRRKMVKELYEALPLPERTLLDAELDRITRGQNPAPTVNGVPKPKPKPKPSSSIKDASMSDSWEEIPRPSQSSGILTNGHVPARAVPSIPTPLSNSLLGLNSSRNGAPPILPISTGPSSGPRPRPSFPLSSSLSSSTSRQPVLFPPSTSNKNGIRPSASVSQPLGESTSFSPASRKANAFYKPPPANPQQDVRRPFESRDIDVDVDGDEDGDGDDENMDIEQADEHADEENNREETLNKQEQETQEEAEWEQHELGFSVFGNTAKTPKPSKKTAAPQPSHVASKSNGRRLPPGAFASDDEAEAEHEHNEPESEPSPPTTKTRTTSRSSKTQTRSAAAMETDTARAPEPKRARRSEHPKAKPRQSVPGALVNTDDEEAEEEEEDDVAPLPSPPRRGAARKARETTPGSDMGDEEAGGQTRRRSSRLSSAGGEMAKKTPSVSASGGGKGKKTTRTSTAKKSSRR